MKSINLMIGTSINGRGGIATVLQVTKDHHFFEQTNTILLASHKTAKLPAGLDRLYVFCTLMLKVIYFGLFYKLGVVHVHMASRGSYTRKSKIIRLAKFFGAKTIIHLHGGGFKEFYQSNDGRKKHILDTFNMADKVIVLSSQWLEWVNTIMIDKTKSCVVYNAVPEVVLPEKKSKQPIILFLGRLGHRKGVEDLINAFAKISAKFPDAQLHLGGDGDLPTYQAQASSLGVSEQVKFLGWVAGETKNQCLADATIYCLPSYNEGFPMGVLEAMSAEVAVVASTAGGIPDAITDKKEGLLIEAGDVDALSIALTTMLEDHNSRAKYVAAAKAKFKNNFSPSVIIPQLKGIYQELLEMNK
jgi:glycosyltransferase involved in cell wall biosynthesis